MYTKPIMVLAILTILATPCVGNQSNASSLIRGDGITATDISVMYACWTVQNSYILANVSDAVHLTGSNNIIRVTSGALIHFDVVGHNNGIVTDAGITSVTGHNNTIYLINEAITDIYFCAGVNNTVYILPNANPRVGGDSNNNIVEVMGG